MRVWCLQVGRRQRQGDARGRGGGKAGALLSPRLSCQAPVFASSLTVSPCRVLFSACSRNLACNGFASQLPTLLQSTAPPTPPAPRETRLAPHSAWQPHLPGVPQRRVTGSDVPLIGSTARGSVPPASHSPTRALQAAGKSSPCFRELQRSLAVPGEMKAPRGSRTGDLPLETERAPPAGPGESGPQVDASGPATLHSA